MHTGTLLTAYMATSAVASVLKLTNGPCGVEPSWEQIEAAHEMRQQESEARKTMGLSNAAQTVAVTTVPIYAHVVASSKSSSGYLDATSIKSQIDRVNSAYSKTSFQFHLEKVDYSVNKSWANNEDEATMKKTLRIGDYKTLNLYFQEAVEPGTSITGHCYFPGTVRSGSDAFYRDGCNIRSDTLQEGTTTPHEIGHWLGLFHTFQGGCSGDGDMVDDTPACEQNTSCKDGIDTCPNSPGKDMVHNYMAYGHCRNEFTSGQATRMRSSYDRYRA